jgi:glyoxylate/hydroxypyruvate reductase A
MNASAALAILLTTGSWAPKPWISAIRTADPERPLHVWPDLPDPAAIGYALVWEPPTGLLSRLPDLKAIFSLGAGVDTLLSQPELPNVPIIRVVNPDLTRRMTEWVTLQVLIHHRHQRVYDRQQAARVWKELRQPAASEVRVGVMGLGVLGRATATMLRSLGFDVAGWGRRPAKLPDVACYHGRDMLDCFLARTDILVALLPLTPQTKGILAMPLFEKLPRDGALGGPVLINAGRGGLQIEADIVAAIERGVLIGASLDVFESEPLDAASPLWTLPDVVITPHAAAASMPKALIPQILSQIRDFEAGKPLQNVVDRRQSY